MIIHEPINTFDCQIISHPRLRQYIYIYVGEICFSVYVENERDKRDVGKMCVNVILFLVRRMI